MRSFEESAGVPHEESRPLPDAPPRTAGALWSAAYRVRTGRGEAASRLAWDAALAIGDAATR